MKKVPSNCSAESCVTTGKRARANFARRLDDSEDLIGISVGVGNAEKGFRYQGKGKGVIGMKQHGQPRGRQGHDCLVGTGWYPVFLAQSDSCPVYWHNVLANQALMCSGLKASSYLLVLETWLPHTLVPCRPALELCSDLMLSSVLTGGPSLASAQMLLPFPLHL